MATAPTSDKLNIANEMLQFDRKNRNFYDELNDEEISELFNAIDNEDKPKYLQ